jgi:hypothetical protein
MHWTCFYYSPPLRHCLAQHTYQYIQARIIPALVVFFIYALPGAIAMYGFSLGVQCIIGNLPNPVYALLSGVNAATVGFMALASVQLARKAITDPLMRILVDVQGCATMLCGPFPPYLYSEVQWRLYGTILLNRGCEDGGTDGGTCWREDDGRTLDNENTGTVPDIEHDIPSTSRHQKSDRIR